MTSNILRKVGLGLVCGTCLCFGACTDPTETIDIGLGGKGADCKQVSDCKAGLTCEDDKCVELEPMDTGPQRGDPCDVEDSSSCGSELYCGRQGYCTSHEPKTEGEECGLTEECDLPYVCNGVSGTCEVDNGEAGTAGLDDDCDDILDCQRPYICGIDDKCGTIPFFTGPNCTRSNEEAGAFRVYFEVPPDTLDEEHEFYRLPFPSDIRLDAAGHVSLDGHAAPDSTLGIDVRGLYFQTAEEDVVGFAVNQPVFFRFSDVIKVESICLDNNSVYPDVPKDLDGDFCAAGATAPPTIYLVDIDPDSPGYNTHVPVQMAMDLKPGQYICQNWLGIAPLDGKPLRHETTYAAIVTKGIRNLANDAPIRDKDFRDFMNGDLTINAMQPLLDWIEDKSIKAGTIFAAAVFTTGNPDAAAPEIRNAVYRESAPTFDNNAVVCDGVAISPCDDMDPATTGRACVGTYTNFYEIQGTYQAPVYQAGTRPYLDPDQGGAFEFDEQGELIQQGTETMCYALALPKDASPPSSYPVVVYAHGTGGNYRSVLSDLAETFTALGYAVIGYDNVMHGPRQNPAGIPFLEDVAIDPGQLFFNLANPRASRDLSLIHI